MQKLSGNKKGLQFQTWLAVAIGIGGGIVFIAVLALVLATVKTASAEGNYTAIVGNGLTFLTNLTGQLGTVGTVAGVLLLVGLLALSGIGGYAMYKKSM
jgi:hypothetical protein